jgi:hypothetical protein
MRRLLALLFALPAVCSAACLSIHEVHKNIGDTTCVTGKVIAVGSSPHSGTHFLNFCEDYRDCPFTVVVFARDLENVGDVRSLAGKQIEVYGTIKEYKGKGEIILSSFRQLRGEAGKLPPLPKHYDVTSRGNASAGKFKAAQAPAKKRRNKSSTTDDSAGEAVSGPTDQE